MLNKRITVSLNHVRLADALKRIGDEGRFYFSYSGRLLPKDSLVTVTAEHQPLSMVLEQLFHGKYAFEEKRNYLIISAVLPHLSLINTDITNNNNTYSISGIVVDELTGERLMNASVYSKEQLAATLTDEHGYFKLKFRTGDPGMLTITASKLSYKDVSLNFLRSVSVVSRTRIQEYKEAAENSKGVERDAFGRFFISARQQIQSLNIPDFFAKQPFQFSLTPGLSTHGLFSSQVINKFSVNIAGGYTAGVDGLEVGGLFNINKGDSRYVQFAGVFNLVGGTVTGVQIAGVTNKALDSVKGVQLAGFINKTEGRVSGLQIAALNNEAHKLKGIQIGLVNVVDSSEGASIGLINIIRNGFYKVSYSASNLTNANLSFTTGTHLFYSTLHIGSNISRTEKLYAFGLGVGHDFMLGSKWYISATADYQLAYTGNWDDRWAQAKLLLNTQLTDKISVFAGPAYNKYSATGSGPGYQTRFRKPEPYYGLGNPVHRWLGWEAGIAFNSVFKQPQKINHHTESWFLGGAAIAGTGFDTNYGLVTGGELFAEREFSGGLAAILSVEYLNNSPRNNGFIHTDIISYINPVYSLPLTTISYYNNNFKALPIKAGMKAYSGKRLFFAGQIGVLVGLNSKAYYIERRGGEAVTYNYDGDGIPFLYSVSMGYSLKNGLEPGWVFQDFVGTIYKHIALRLAYRLKVGK
ncbi:carboxypeptidase-like regulatory domain-containing protein [Pedobacter hartonius]|uniref:carboxypeptidase-like regulatory domain-containing protein n=1 Tax=Pedobacter hartonius TaxID=425514 RepID=UPI001587F2BD|nr:carboxypeptidase-like regulatory domain-containing protein [Pedobacter hartonius]